MKTERIVLSIIAILIGLSVAGIVFYFFQMAGKKPEEKKNKKLLRSVTNSRLKNQHS
jgi:preprotein translocase subunit YajC